MSSLLELSSRFIDEGIYEGQGSVNRPTGQLSEIADDIALIEAFSHVVVLRTDAGLLLGDTSVSMFGAAIVSALRGWSYEPVDTILYTHGHIDHVGGAPAIVADAEERGDRRPAVLAHENVPVRFDRYDLTNGYNAIINQRQFGQRGRLGMAGPAPRFFDDWVEPTTTFRETLDVEVGGLRIELRHDRGETDDHAWAWIPQHKAILSGDFLTWVFPNAGNPQKVQRYPLEWARALRTMASLEPELLLPAHGLPIDGKDRIARVLDDVARALETLVDQTLALMNEGARLDRIVHEVRVPDDLLERPYLQPVYDEPEFVVRNIWRLYGGWYDGNPAHLKPAPDAHLAAEIAHLAGGADKLALRARELVERPNADDRYAAAQLVEYAAQADPNDARIRHVRHEVYETLRRHERSLMSQGIYRAAAEDSASQNGDEPSRD
ncbi:MAG TPA: alkyl sulfatase dimerization domain-containing protein [Acidimicrobiales bacterium]|jgi:alkyl sulfatase BDS1-like metallo-beta-lactamase superfamily hydrolase|nr:alkyl sulfatase dimerization domain-containing protein [Acidimicrobiales bacterium]